MISKPDPGVFQNKKKTHQTKCLQPTPCRHICASKFTRPGARRTRPPTTKPRAHCRRRLQQGLQRPSRTSAARPPPITPSDPWTTSVPIAPLRPPWGLPRRLPTGDGGLVRSMPREKAARSVLDASTLSHGITHASTHISHPFSIFITTNAETRQADQNLNHGSGAQTSRQPASHLCTLATQHQAALPTSPTHQPSSTYTCLATAYLTRFSLTLSPAWLAGLQRHASTLQEGKGSTQPPANPLNHASTSHHNAPTPKAVAAPTEQPGPNSAPFLEYAHLHAQYPMHSNILHAVRRRMGCRHFGGFCSINAANP